MVVVSAYNMFMQNNCPEVCTLRTFSDALHKCWASTLDDEDCVSSSKEIVMLGET